MKYVTIPIENPGRIDANLSALDQAIAASCFANVGILSDTRSIIRGIKHTLDNPPMERSQRIAVIADALAEADRELRAMHERLYPFYKKPPQPGTDARTCHAINQVAFARALLAGIVEKAHHQASKDRPTSKPDRSSEPATAPTADVDARQELLDWAETLLCNSDPMPHCEQDDWNATIKNWRDQKHAIQGHRP